MSIGYRSLRVLAVLALALPLVAQGSPRAQAQTGFADPAFQRTWERTDQPVAAGKANRSWYWGPTPNFSVLEPYKEAPGGQRKVQYFDKTRMEINNPAANPNDPFYVTNGLLARELLTGQMQVGDNTYQTSCPAAIPLASDTDDSAAPTYATFGALLNAPKSNRVGQKATATINGAGAVGDDPSKAGQPGVGLVYYDPTTQRNIPQVFWEFLNQQGTVYVNGQYVTAAINNPWFFASGLPITEAYWANVKIGGKPLDVMIQVFERRVLTYIPAYNGSPFNVQMGNVGQHYYDWRYKGAGCVGGQPTPPPSGPTATPVTPPTAAPQPTAAPDCSGIPAPKNATITPNCGEAGKLEPQVVIMGFAQDELISFWLTDPDGQVVGTPRPLDFGPHGAVLDLGTLDTSGLDPGIWAFTFQGQQSNNISVVWFKIVPTNGGGGGSPTATPGPPVACDSSATHDATVSPVSGPVGTDFEIKVTGFQGGETASYWITDPDGLVFGNSQTQVTIDSDGTFDGFLDTSRGGYYAGRWALTVHGLSSNHEAIGVFCMSP